MHKRDVKEEVKRQRHAVSLRVSPLSIHDESLRGTAKNESDRHETAKVAGRPLHRSHTHVQRVYAQDYSNRKLTIAVSYMILTLTWVAFNLVVALHETLLRRQEVYRFFVLIGVYNALFAMTILSFIVASSRSPGSPNRSQSFDPPQMSERKDRPALTLPEPPRSAPPVQLDGDDIPLRFLKNAQWVTARGSKDRPSPLPLSTKPAWRQIRDESEGSADSDYFPSVSPFPLAISPLLPKSPHSAGQESPTYDEEHDRLAGAAGIEFPAGDSSDPTRRPRRYSTPGQDSRLGLMAKSSTGGPRWCKKCDGWKPDRCHHCRYCDRCVLKMDHHCVWLGSCVGYHNYKPFILFISYGSLLALFTAVTTIMETIRYFDDPEFFITVPPRPANVTCTTSDCSQKTSDQAPQVDLSPVVTMLLAVMGCFITLAVGGLWCYHLHLAMQNHTTLEDMTHSFPTALVPPTNNESQSPHTPNVDSNFHARWKPDHILSSDERRRLRREAHDINVYDLGWRRNLKEVWLGPGPVTLLRVILMFWPMARAVPRNGGHAFPYDPVKLAQLRQITAELRLGAAPASPDSLGEEERGLDGDLDSRGSGDEYDFDTVSFTMSDDDNEMDDDAPESARLLPTVANHADPI